MRRVVGDDNNDDDMKWSICDEGYDENKNKDEDK